MCAMKSEPFDDLSGSYKRGIEASLALLDESICRFEEWAGGRQVRSVLYLESNGLNPAQRQKILAEVRSMRAILRELREVFGLEPHIETAAKSIWSHCSNLWVTLAEMESKRMRGYGEAPEGFAQYWDPKLNAIE